MSQRLSRFWSVVLVASFSAAAACSSAEGSLPGSGAPGGAGTQGGPVPPSPDATDGGAASDVPADAAPAGDIGDVLRAIPGITVVTEVKDPPDAQAPRVPSGYRRFELTIEQPMNHDDPASPRFAQRLSLLHRDVAGPTILATSGYALSTGRSELTRLFAANQIQVEHRYFASSIPKNADWKFLDIRQSAADFHAIVQALRPVYRGRWVNTGASKGGMTSLYHRRFYPADVDGTVAYVAPLVYGTDDARFPSFLEGVGGPAYAACREALKGLQRAVLDRRAEVEAKMEGTYESLGGKAVALEHAVLEMPFAFWQYGDPDDKASGCPAIPAADAPLDGFYRFFADVAQVTLYSDDGFAYFSPYYYQAATELGAPGVEDEHLLGTLKYRATYAPASYVPKGINVTFKPEVMPDVQTWVKERGDGLMFVYGEYDPWTAGRVELGNARDSFVYIAPKDNHGAKVASLADEDRKAALATLERWLGASVQTPALVQAAALRHDEEAAEERRGRL